MKCLLQMSCKQCKRDGCLWWFRIDYGLQLMRLLVWWCVVTSPCGCEPPASHIECDPVCVRPGVELMRTVWVIWWICGTWFNEDGLRQLKTDLRAEQCYNFKLTDKRVSIRYIQDIIISVNRCNTHVLCLWYVHINIHKRSSYCTNLMRAISSIRPPFPLYMLAAFIPNFVLATDSRSARVP